MFYDDLGENKLQLHLYRMFCGHLSSSDDTEYYELKREKIRRTECLALARGTFSFAFMATGFLAIARFHGAVFVARK